jgi:hypothetical protein
MTTTVSLDIDLSARFLKVACPVHMAGTSRQIKEVAQDVEISQGARVGRAVKASKMLYSDEYFTRLKAAKNAIKAQHMKLTSVWNDSSWRLLPTGQWFAYANQMNPLIAEFDAAADELATKWDAMISEARDNMGNLFDLGDYPDTPSEFRSMFRAEVTQEPLPQISDATRISLPASELAAMQKSMERAMAANIANVKSEVFGRLQKTTEALAKSLMQWDAGNQKSVKKTLLDSVRSACSYASSFNIDGDSRIDALLKEIDDFLAHDMETIRESPALRGEVIDAANRAASKAAARKSALANMAGYMQ